MKEEQPEVIALILTQLSLKAGLKEWVTRVHNFVHSYMKKLNFIYLFKLMHCKELYNTQGGILSYSYMLHKQKRDIKSKGHTVAGGNKQRYYISKKYVSSKIVATESMLLICIIDANKEGYVAVINISNASI